MARTTEPDLITVADAATEVRKHHRTVRRWIAQGKLPAYRVAGWAVLVDRADLRELVRPITAGKSA